MPDIPSPAFNVWGAASSENPAEASNSHQSMPVPQKIPKQIAINVPEEPYIVRSAIQPNTPPYEYSSSPNGHSFVEETAMPPMQDDPDSFPSLGGKRGSDSFPSQRIKDDSENFPSLGGKEEILSNAAAAPPPTQGKGKGKKGRGGRKGQQILTLGVNRMSIN